MGHGLAHRRHDALSAVEPLDSSHKVTDEPATTCSCAGDKNGRMQKTTCSPPCKDVIALGAPSKPHGLREDHAGASCLRCNLLHLCSELLGCASTCTESSSLRATAPPNAVRSKHCTLSCGCATQLVDEVKKQNLAAKHFGLQRALPTRHTGLLATPHAANPQTSPTWQATRLANEQPGPRILSWDVKKVELRSSALGVWLQSVANLDYAVRHLVGSMFVVRRG